MLTIKELRKIALAESELESLDRRKVTITVGETTILVDADIADLVIWLNENGYETLFSCAGHINHGQCYILFKDSTRVDKLLNTAFDKIGTLFAMYSFKITVTRSEFSGVDRICLNLLRSAQYQYTYIAKELLARKEYCNELLDILKKTHAYIVFTRKEANDENI